jgi:hypothetical protein
LRDRLFEKATGSRDIRIAKSCAKMPKPCCQASDSTVFVEFMLNALATSLAEAATDQVTDQVTDQATVQAELSPIAQIAAAMGRGEALTASELMQRIGLRQRAHFRQNYLVPAMEAGILEMTQPEVPRSPNQRYRRTARRLPKRR